MKLIALSLLAGGTLVSADVPNADFDECIIIAMDVTAPDPTYIDPDPAATSMQLIVNCGQRVLTEQGNPVNQQSLKYIQMDLDQAEVIVRAAADLLGDDGVYLPE